MTFNTSLCTVESSEVLTEAWIIERLNQGCQCKDLEIKFSQKEIHCHPPVNREAYISISFSILLAIIILLSLIGGLVVLWVIIGHKKMRTTKNAFLFNLIFTDLIAILLIASFKGFYNIFRDWIFPEWFCPTSNSLSASTINVCSFTMIAMSFQRHRAIITPFKKDYGLIKTVGGIIVIWLVSLLSAVPTFLESYSSTYFYIDASNNSIAKYNQCLDDKWISSPLKYYKYILIFIQFILPIISFIIYYAPVLYSLYFKPVINDASNASNQRQKHKAGKMVIYIVASFFLLWLPYSSYSLFIKNLIQENLFTDYVVSNIVFIIAMVTCVVDPWIYCFMNKKFNVGFRYIFRWAPFIKFDREVYDRAFSTDTTASINFL